MSTHAAATIAEVTHHTAAINGAELHYVGAGAGGPPVLLVHGFPESWWAFHKVIPLMARQHRVFAVDLRGFGDSSVAGDDFDSRVAAADLHALIGQLGVGPVHLVAQDIAGATALRLALSHPGDLASFTAIEMGLPGFGLEALADVTHGGAWHIGVLARPEAVTVADIAEFARGYAREGGWRGASGLYRSMLREGAEVRELVAAAPLRLPVLAIGAGGGAFTADTMSRVTAGRVQSVLLPDTGHYAALEAPDKLADAITTFIAGVKG